MIEFATPPKIGTLLKLDDQVYRLTEIEPHTRLDGTPTVLLVWCSTCPACNAGFVVKSGLKTKAINRRCGSCHNTGKPVLGRRNRKVKVQVTHA